MGTVVLGLNKQIKWPNYCVICNKEATDCSAANKTNLTKIQYYLVALSYTTKSHTLMYPVCAKHKTLCDLLYKPLSGITIVGSIVIGIILWAIFFALIYIILIPFGLETAAKDVISPLSAVFAIGSVSFYFIYAIFFPPVGIRHLSEYSVEISIRNEKYFNDFKLVNIDDVLQ
jgi:hypothetical protein